MSIDQRKVIDFVSMGGSDGRCVLTISDHLAWDDPEHLAQLQDKLNDYLAFVESGEIYERFPKARECDLEIEVFCKQMPPADDPLPFLEHAAKKIRGAGIQFAVRGPADLEHHVA